MNLKDLGKKGMSEEQKKKLISELRAEILKICPWPIDSQEDIKTGLRLKKILEEENAAAKAKGDPIPFPADYGKEEEITEENLTKQELLEKLGAEIMKEVFPYWPRLAFLNANVELRRENQKAREKGMQEPHNVSEVEPEADRAERCFGVCPYWSGNRG